MREEAFENLGEEEVLRIINEGKSDVKTVRAAREWLTKRRRRRERDATEHLENERAIAKWTRVLGAFTIVLALTSILTAGILYITDQTSRLRDRAFIYFGDPQIRPYPDAAPTVWGVGISVANAGNMPASRVAIRYACPDAPFSVEVPDSFLLVKQWKTAQVASVIGPKQAATLRGCELPIDLVNEAKQFQRQIFVLLEAQYLDGFELNTTRVTQMSRVLGFDKSGGQSLNFTSTHNCSDSDCPKVFQSKMSR
jgi:hypothetical protein